MPSSARKRNAPVRSSSPSYELAKMTRATFELRTSSIDGPHPSAAR